MTKQSGGGVERKMVFVILGIANFVLLDFQENVLAVFWLFLAYATR